MFLPCYLVLTYDNTKIFHPLCMVLTSIIIVFILAKKYSIFHIQTYIFYIHGFLRYT